MGPRCLTNCSSDKHRHCPLSCALQVPFDRLPPWNTPSNLDFGLLVVCAQCLDVFKYRVFTR